ncbi:hypothetical protein I553_0934 [Mycobacterium xenopi 4042]|uniref:Uncharacterized protein n=1 Tax=Mycobacterium xenopi 4042 TaxID=1299334 RepID=X7ZBJ7_MYCXE|nr:hypothetical protein I553_0934 [Mycobacterium xenopi 4042]
MVVAAAVRPALVRALGQAPAPVPQQAQAPGRWRSVRWCRSRWGAGAGAGVGDAGTWAFGAGGATACSVGTTTCRPMFGRSLTCGRILIAKESTSATTPTTKMVNTPITTRNGLRLGCSVTAAVKPASSPAANV